MSTNLRYSNTTMHYAGYGNGNVNFPTRGNYPEFVTTERMPRRRKRPSNRTRERKPMVRYDDYSDSIAIARDTDFKLPSPSSPPASPRFCTTTTPLFPSKPPTSLQQPRTGNRSNASPLLRKNFDQSWLRWKEKERAEEKERDMRMFGGEDCEGDGDGDDGGLDLGEKMLEVVRSLFGGEIDFGYP